MEQQLEQIREQQKQTWNKFSSGWKKWDDLAMEYFQPIGDEMIHSLRLKDSDVVLDIAAGTGEPGLSIAGIVKNGKVVITDLAEAMIEIARDKAKERGLTNYEAVVCDVSELPFENATFDAISCRLGFMFFPDMLLGAKEMARVLKPGGRMAAAVWGSPEKNFHATAIVGMINKYMQLPQPPPGGPGIFRCSEPGLIAGLFKQAGLKNVVEKEVNGKMNFGSNDNYWGFMNEVAAPVVAAMSKADDLMKEKIKKDVYELVDQKYPDKKAAIDYSTLVISGEK